MRKINNKKLLYKYKTKQKCQPRNQINQKTRLKRKPRVKKPEDLELVYKLITLINRLTLLTTLPTSIQIIALPFQSLEFCQNLQIFSNQIGMKFCRKVLKLLPHATITHTYLRLWSRIRHLILANFHQSLTFWKIRLLAVTNFPSQPKIRLSWKIQPRIRQGRKN